MPILWRSYGCHRPKEYFRFWNLWIFCNGKCIWEMARSIMVIYLCIAQARSSSWNLGDQASDVDRGSEMIPTSLRCTSWRVQFSWSLLRDSGRNLPNKNMAKRQLKKTHHALQQMELHHRGCFSTYRHTCMTSKIGADHIPSCRSEPLQPTRATGGLTQTPRLDVT